MGAFAAVGPRFVKLAHAAGSGPSPAPALRAAGSLESRSRVMLECGVPEIWEPQNVYANQRVERNRMPNRPFIE
jgi:hypothetical protein